MDTGNIKEVKDHAKASEEKNKAVDISGVEKTNDKLLPWEDIVPPKTKP